MSRQFAVVALVLSFAGAAPAQPSDELSRSWERASSEHFVAVGNADGGSLRAALKELELFRFTLLQLFPQLELDAPVPITLVLFRNQEEIRRHSRGGRSVAGYFQRNPDVIYMVASAQQDRSDTFFVLFHEYTHFIVNRAMRNVPTWANEGIAEFYGTYRTDASNRGVIGSVPAWRRNTLLSEPLLPLDRLATPAGVAKTLRNDNDVNRFYAASWLLVHYLMVGDRAGQIVPYLQAVQNGSSMEEAFVTTFQVSFEQMRRELEAYLRKPALPALGIPVPPALSRAEPKTEPMREVEELRLRADILLRNGAPTEAAALLNRAGAVDPANPRLRLLGARLALAEQRYDEAIAELQAVAAAASTDFAAHYWLASALSQAGRAVEAVTAASRATAINAQSPDGWVQLALTALAANREAQSNAALIQALRLEDNPQWFHARAHKAWETGHFGVITRDVDAYIARAGLDRGDYVSFLGVLAHRRLSQPERADRLLGALAPTLDEKSWSASITRFLRGELNPAELLKRAKTSGERTEARGYIGLMASINGDRDTALTELRWVRDKGDKTYTEYRFAVAELTRLEAQPPAGDAVQR